MKTFGHILVPTDFGRCSEAAFGAASLLSKALGADVTLLHVVDVAGHEFSGDAFVPMPDLIARALDDAQLALDASRDHVQGCNVVRSAVRVGTASTEILAAADEAGADLIVMGTHGRTGFARAFLGSTAEKVVRMSSVPVLTVHGADYDKETTGTKVGVGVASAKPPGRPAH